MATYSIAPFIGAFYQGLLKTGLIIPNAAGSIQVYLAGTTTPTSTWSDNGTTLNANPILLDSSGRCVPGEVWLDNTVAYKFVVSDASANVLATYDNVYPTGSTLGLNGSGANTTGPFAAVLTSPGYQKLPSGFIIQWGQTVTIASAGSAVVTLPIAFPAAALAAQVSPVGAGAGTFDLKGSVALTSSTSITVYNVGTIGPVTFNWFVIGH